MIASDQLNVTIELPAEPAADPVHYANCVESVLV